MDAQMKRGFLDACVLATMASKESYGYQIIKDLPEMLEVSESTLYPILKRMEAKKLIRVRKAEHNGRLRKYYSLTSQGHAELASFVADRQDVMDIFRFVEESIDEAASSAPKNESSTTSGA